MRELHSLINLINTEGYYKDKDAMGVFVDNSMNSRFMAQYQDKIMLKNALAFSLTFTGIPFFYYGSEYAYLGGLIPNNRESLW